MKTLPKYRPRTVDEQLLTENVEKYRSLMIEAFLKGKSPPSRVSRMLNIEGVGEFWTGSGYFKAAVQTEEGRKILEGEVARERSRTEDIQSGPMVRWQHALDKADEAIRFAYDNLLPAEALKTISTIWEHLDRTSELAAARSRLLMGKVDKPGLAELPKWFEEQEPTLRNAKEGELAANPFAIESARLLVRAAYAAAGKTDKPEAELEVGPLGRVMIDWYFVGSRFQWMVEAIDLPWPSVKVYQLLRRSDVHAPKPVQTRILHNAYDAVESFTEFVQGK
ncbi:MAG TPA: hypothetical protein VMY42_12270 [Thermoguttaceae bacterium]|nr:hypothetical protein [Thermoguttaceae bacterium]